MVSETYLISIDIAPNSDVAVLSVFKRNGFGHEQIKSFHDVEAIELYHKLTRKEQKSGIREYDGVLLDTIPKEYETE